MHRLTLLVCDTTAQVGTRGRVVVIIWEPGWRSGYYLLVLWHTVVSRLAGLGGCGGIVRQSTICSVVKLVDILRDLS